MLRRTPLAELLHEWGFEKGSERVAVTVDGWLLSDNLQTYDASLYGGRLLAAHQRSDRVPGHRRRQVKHRSSFPASAIEPHNVVVLIFHLTADGHTVRHDLAKALGIPVPGEPGKGWSFTRYAPLMTVEESAMYNSSADEVV